MLVLASDRVCVCSPKEILDFFVSLPAESISGVFAKTCILKMYYTGQLTIEFLKSYLWEAPPSELNLICFDLPVRTRVPLLALS